MGFLLIQSFYAEKNDFSYIENSVDISIYRNIFSSFERIYIRNNQTFLYVEIYFPDMKKKILYIEMSTLFSIYEKSLFSVYDIGC